MEPQLLRCGNHSVKPMEIMTESSFNGATTFALWKLTLIAVPVTRFLPSMEPQLLRCGNQALKSVHNTAEDLLQWSHNFCVVETQPAGSAAYTRYDLQWSHNFCVVETASVALKGTAGAILQWSHNFCVVETCSDCPSYWTHCRPSMEPQLLRCGNKL